MAEVNATVAWVTGASRGIGAAISRELAKSGHRVVLSARTPLELDRVVHEIIDSGGQALAQACDVSQKESVDKTVAAIQAAWGPVQILVNNAGTAVFRKIIDTREQDWDTMMSSNAKSAFLCTQAVLPAMLAAQAGHIINIVSIAGRQPYYNCGAYCASKYALQGFTDVLRQEVRKHGIRVTAVLPGATDTAIWGESKVDHSRMMSPEQVGQAVAALCQIAPPVMIEELLLRPQGGDL